MSLKELFEKVDVNYYNNQKSSFEKDFKEGVNLIHEFYKLGMKESLCKSLLDNDEFRIKHSTSLLYFGILIAEQLQLDLTIHVGEQDFELNYYWSLLCLFHDLGYCIEKNKNEFYRVREENLKYLIKDKKYLRDNRIIKGCVQTNLQCRFTYKRFFINSINQVIYYIQNTSYLTKYGNRLGRDCLHYNFYEKLSNIKFRGLNIEIARAQYWENTINAYLHYREEEFGCMDHGIIGGYIFFDRFIKNYISKMEEHNRYERFYDFTIGDIYFKIEQIPLIAYISDCIVSHNIFLPDEAKLELYENYELKQLCKLKKISFKKNPVLFLFDLVDAIDPIKFFKSDKYNYDLNDILENIDVKFSSDKKMIIVLNSDFLKLEEITSYKNHIKSITLWLDIVIEEIINGIAFKFIYD